MLVIELPQCESRIEKHMSELHMENIVFVCPLILALRSLRDYLLRSPVVEQLSLPYRPNAGERNSAFGESAKWV